MFGNLYPAEYLDSAYTIDYEALYKAGYRGIIFDIDNTLVPHGVPADEKAVNLFESLRKIGFQTILVSNNKEPRVASFAEQVGSLYLFKAGKPKKAGYFTAMSKMGTSLATTVCIGDQIFTDMWGANRIGIHTVLTKPIDPKEEIQIILKRIPEKAVLFFYRRKKKA